jgi:hypothetical protein
LVMLDFKLLALCIFPQFQMSSNMD